MLIRRSTDIRGSEITDERLYLDRRAFLDRVRAQVAGVAAVTWAAARSRSAIHGQTPIPGVQRAAGTTEPLTPFDAITSYNNFYEFGVDKEDPKRYAGRLTTRPWTVKVDGHVAKPAEYAIDDLIALNRLEERIYRLRCVEAWSMVVPWVGFPLSNVIEKVEPTSRAKFVAFSTLHRLSEMPGQRTDVLEWPYREGLRMDEARHPLTIVAVGLYGKTLLNQNGAPLRLVVPWKYGFKSIKSIVRISFVEKMPLTSWVRSAPDEYGFYANVNPDVSHPRWSQARERRIGDFFKRPTLMFNGYAEQVGSMYAGMDLKRQY